MKIKPLGKFLHVQEEHSGYKGPISLPENISPVFGPAVYRVLAVGSKVNLEIPVGSRVLHALAHSGFQTLPDGTMIVSEGDILMVIPCLPLKEA